MPMPKLWLTEAVSSETIFAETPGSVRIPLEAEGLHSCFGLLKLRQLG